MAKKKQPDGRTTSPPSSPRAPLDTRRLAVQVVVVILVLLLVLSVFAGLL